MKLNAYFDRIVVINLPERADRRRQIAGELAPLGLHLATGEAELFDAIRPDTAGDFPSRGARGAYLSHLEVLRRAHRDGIERLLVLEDDLVIDRRLAREFAGLAEKLRASDWDILYLGHLGEERPEEISLRSTDAAQQCLHFYAVQGRQLAPLIAYLEACLERPAGHPEGGAMHVDGAISMYRARQPACRTLLVEPSLGWQRPSRSDITDNRWYDRLPVLRAGVAILRRGKGLLGNRRRQSA